MFLFLYVVTGGLMVASLYVTRFQRRKPTKLNLKAPSNPIATPVSGKPVVYDPNNLRNLNPRPTTQLTVMFNFNGHAWEAYEALGLPAGSAPELVLSSYRDIVDSVDPESRHFYDLALQAIIESSKRAS